MLTLTSTIDQLPKITKPQIAALKKLGILNIENLLFYFPFRYLDFSQNKKIKDLKPSESVSIKATLKIVKSRYSFRGHRPLAEAIVSDDTGSIKVTWFNQAYLAKILKVGEELFLAGAPQYYKGSLQLINPFYEKVSDFPIHTSRLVPVYHLTSKLYPKTLRKLIADVLPLAENVTEILPKNILDRLRLLPISQTIRFSHFPDNLEQVRQAQKRLAFEEIFLNQLSAQKHKLELAQKQSFPVPFDQSLIKQFVDNLPFKLTTDQKKAAWQILLDLEKSSPMNRLLEGDVGSGKTLVALIAALQTISKGLQAAFLVPTEILAKQHFETAKKILNWKTEIKNWKLGLLTNAYSIVNNTAITKQQLQNLISEGVAGLYIGTHALLQERVRFKNLALVITDEQHRFGVLQRARLLQSKGKVPHLLSLTATPIPRTLQLAFFGELDVSQIKTKPRDRKTIITRLVAPTQRPQAYEFIRKQIQQGRQAFVITPLIEESGSSHFRLAETEKLGVKSAKTEAENLRKVFPEFQIGLLHGKLKSKTKEQLMNDFLAGKLQILVSTSVVEVGVDVPNASVMVIEGAERFGLAQLHQFRGRVGRAQHQSYCFLFSEKEDEQTQKRLRAFAEINNGFELAELDLKQRGFGEIYGEQQWGWQAKYFDPTYTSLIPLARQEAREILKFDFNLDKYPLLKDKIKDQIIHFE